MGTCFLGFNLILPSVQIFTNDLPISFTTAPLHTCSVAFIFCWVDNINVENSFFLDDIKLCFCWITSNLFSNLLSLECAILPAQLHRPKAITGGKEKSSCNGHEYEFFEF